MSIDSTVGKPHETKELLIHLRHEMRRLAEPPYPQTARSLRSSATQKPPRESSVGMS